MCEACEGRRAYDHGDPADLVRTPTPRALAAGVLASVGGDPDRAIGLLCAAVDVLDGLLDPARRHDED